MEHDTRSKGNKGTRENIPQKNNIRQISGRAPADNPKAFNIALTAVVKDFNLVTDSEIMMGNRMVATFMQLQYIESEIKKRGLFFGDGPNLRMNPMCDHQSKLQNDLMRLYRMFKAKLGKEDSPKNFIDFLEDAQNRSDKAKD